MLIRIDATTNEWKSNNSSVRHQKVSNRSQKNEVSFDINTSAWKTATVVMLLGTLLYCAYMTLSLGLKVV